MNILIAFALFIIGVVLLIKGADWFLDGVQDLALSLGISAVVLGILLASLEPEEMLTAAIASFRGAPALAVGNVLGTNIVITTLAIGLSALIFPIAIDRTIRRQAVIVTIVSIIPTFFLLTGSVSRLAGLFMLLLFGGYTFLLLRQKPPTLHQLEDELTDDDDDAKQPPRLLPLLVLTFGGLIAMALGGFLLVEGALQLAASFGVSEGLIGATIVSLGTGAEMIALGVTAARKRQADILVGGVIGSFAYNLLVTLGVAAVIRPLPVDTQAIRVSLIVMIGVHLLLLALVWRGQISRLMGGVLIVVYLVYLVIVVFPAVVP
jgi:cation:H+ antiporter